MALSNQTVKAIYQGDGSNTTFAIPFTPIVSDSNETVVYIRDETDPENITLTLQEEGALNDYVLTGRPTPQDFHVNVEMSVAPTATQKVVVTRVLPKTQTLDLQTSGILQPESLENQLDRIVALIQQLNEILTRVPKLNPGEIISELGMVLPEPVANTVFGWNETADALKQYTPTEFALAAGSINGATDVAYDNTTSELIAENVQDAIDELDTRTDDLDTPIEGYSARFGEAWSSTDLLDAVQQIIDITYTAPTISLTASGSTTIREKGDEVTSSTLTAAITKRSDPIAEVRFYNQTDGDTLLDTQTSGGGIPDGGNSTYAWTGSFDDTQVFRAEVDDNGATGGPTTVSSTRTFTFVYPYYVGAGTTGLSAANVASLTKRIITEDTSRTETITATAGQVFYFAYPASYGTLSSILDVNGFETLPDWTLRVENITGLDGNAVSYNIYEFNNPVTADDYEYTFNQ